MKIDEETTFVIYYLLIDWISVFCVWLVTNCAVASRRDKLALKLLQFIDVCKCLWKISNLVAS